MKALLLILIAFNLFLGASLSAQDYQKLKPKNVPKQPPREFQFIAYFYNHVISNNIFATNDFLRGQTVGRLFGGNTTTTGKVESFYLEQRLLPFFIYQPKLGEHPDPECGTGADPLERVGDEPGAAAPVRYAL
jgi:hypothetical protein